MNTTQFLPSSFLTLHSHTASASVIFGYPKQVTLLQISVLIFWKILSSAVYLVNSNASCDFYVFSIELSLPFETELITIPSGQLLIPLHLHCCAQNCFLWVHLSHSTVSAWGQELSRIHPCIINFWPKAILSLLNRYCGSDLERSTGGFLCIWKGEIQENCLSSPHVPALNGSLLPESCSGTPMPPQNCHPFNSINFLNSSFFPHHSLFCFPVWQISWFGLIKTKILRADNDIDN